MSNIKYVIRQRHFFYNDERYEIDPEWEGAFELGTIKEIFDNPNQAQDYCKKLNIQSARQTNLHYYEVFIESWHETNQIIQEYGYTLADTDGELKYYLPAELTDEQIYHFIEKINLLPFVVLEYPFEQTFCVIWLPYQKSYLRSESDELMFHEQEQGFFAYHHYEIMAALEEAHPNLNGTLQDLSHSPTLLKNLIENSPHFESDATGIYIHYNGDIGGEDLQALNELLIQPIFEFHHINFNTLRELLGDTTNE